jgi:predicted ATPase/class 3 adenylate cyclase
MQQMADWLKKLGMSEYTERFAENGISFAALRHLTDQDLKDIGVLLGHRRIMLAAIQELAAAAPSAPTPTEATRQDTAERRQLSVMFTDLVGSTALSTKLDPEDLRGIIAAYHRCCTELVERNGGFVAKYMGDGVLAYFGYPQAHEHDAERAVRAALNLVEAVPKLATNAGSPLQVRIGIATGLVVVGDLIGAGAAQEQAVVGETPNLAARLQALAEPGAVVIAAATRRLTGGLFDYRDLGTMALKGLGENVPAWQVLGAGTAESRFEALRGTTTPLVGRDEEIDLLMRRWEQAKRRDGCVVLISGEPGIGKSRIAQTVVERISAEPHTRLRYFCSPHHQDSALYPSIAQLERAAGFRRDDADEQRLNKLEAVLAQATNDLSEAVPLLAELLSIPTGDRYPLLNLTPQKRKEKTLQAQLAQVEGLAARQPVLMVWEDVHWSDPTTRELLDLLIDRVATLRVLVIITFRPEFAPPWAGRPHVTMLTLNRLPPRQRAEMIAYVTSGKALPPAIAEQIVDRTDGVPLFIEELTKSVVESGILTEAGDHYALAGAMVPLAIPASLHASLLARLDRLAPTREVAQIGAALGRQFSHELISAVATMPTRELDDALAQLVSAELLFRRGTPPDAEYTFKHALVQDAAYSTLLKSRRQQIHARIAAILEQKFSDIVAAQPELLAQHCDGAGLTEKAVDYWLVAGRQAWARSMSMEAVSLLRRGLALITTLPETDWRREHELDLQIALGQALIAIRGWATQEMGEAYARARQLAETLNRPREILFAMQGEFQYHVSRADLNRARQLSALMCDKGESERNIPMQVLGYDATAYTSNYLGEYAVARIYIEKGLALYDPEHRPFYTELLANDMLLQLLVHSTMPMACLGFIDQSLSRIDAALTESRQLSNRLNLTAALAWAWMRGWCVQTEPKLLLQYADENLALSGEHGIEFFRAYGLMHRGWCLSLLGRPEEGIPLCMAGLANLHDFGFMAMRPLHLTLVSEACRMGGEFQRALEYVDQAQQTANETQELMVQAETLRLRGDLLRCTGDPRAAEGSYSQALAVARQQSAKLWELRASASLARLWRDQGRPTEARNLLAPIYDWFTEGFDTPVLKEAKTLLDELAWF